MQRFWDKVDKTGKCWIWTAGKLKTGYGCFKLDGRTQMAHRVSWFLVYGVWPEHEIDHLCRNTSCVNPAHLEDVTHAINIKRGNLPQRRITHCPQGHEYTNENTQMRNGKRYCRTCKGWRGGSD